MSLTKDALFQTTGHFTWTFGQEFFVETHLGNFVWNSPDYEGDNTMTLYQGTWQDYRREEAIDMGRDKGMHSVERYCGDGFTLVVPEGIAHGRLKQEQYFTELLKAVELVRASGMNADHFARTLAVGAKMTDVFFSETDFLKLCGVWSEVTEEELAD